MKKILSAVLLAALLMSLATCAFAATGLGVVTTLTNTAATAEKDGSVSSYTFMCALSLDAEGKIESVTFDALQTKGTFNTAGELTCEEFTEPQTKIELGDGYGMRKASPIGKEWFEQMAAFEAWCVGKTVEEVVAGAADDVDLKAGCTVGIDSPLVALQKAAAAAK